MKKLLTVTAVALCICLTYGFNISTDNESATAKNHRTSIRKWKNTTWVNPWVKTVRISENILAYTINNSWNPGRLCQLTTHRGGIINIMMDGYKWFTFPAGYTCTYEAAMNPNPPFDAYVGEVVDMTTSTTIYSYWGPNPTYFQWTPVADHWYEVYTQF
jgi:hypothetical protein